MWIWAIAGILVVGVGLALVFVLIARRRRSELLRQVFGVEYERVIDSAESRWAAERELQSRLTRRRQYQLHALSGESKQRFTELWRGRNRYSWTLPLAPWGRP